MRIAPILIPILLLAASAPATAGWGGKGAYEPDTPRDVTEGWMQTSPDTTPVPTDPTQTGLRKVYFNGFIGQWTPTGFGSLSPNLASIGSARTTTPYNFLVMMGVWKDCNRDTYVGYGDNGLFEYRAELLIDRTVCPVQVTPVSIPFNWYPTHNDGQWVREFLPIQWSKAGADVTGDINRFNINDNGSRVWADVGLPNSTAAASAVCNWAAYGMTRSTGGFLRWADCFAGYRVTDNLTAIASATGADGLGAGQLSFKDKPREQDQSQSRLNQPNPWGHEGGSSYVDAWDCGKPQLVNQGVGDARVNVSQPRAPPNVRTAGTVAGTANSTGSGFDQCQRTSNNNGKFHAGQDAAFLPYSVEEDSPLQGEPESNIVVKASTDVLAPSQTARGILPSSALGSGTPPDYGARVMHTDGFWSALGRTITPLANRATLTPSVYTTTYYGIVSASAVSAYKLTMPKGTTLGKYGSEVCGASAGVVGAPNKDGWVCDKSKWWQDGEGLDNEPRSTDLGGGADAKGVRVGAYVGDSYNLRDIDCHDESTTALRAAGIPPGITCVRP